MIAEPTTPGTVQVHMASRFAFRTLAMPCTPRRPASSERGIPRTTVRAANSGVELLRTWCLEENSSWMNSLLNIRTYSLKPDTALSDNMKPDDGVPGIVSTLASSILCAVAKTAQADTARFRFAPVVHIPQSTRAAHSE